METLLKRHFWAITLVGLAIIAWLMAGSVNAFVGMMLTRAGRGDDKPNIAAASGDTAVAKRLRDGRITEQGAAIVVGRSIFLIEEPKVEEPVDDESLDIEKEQEVAAPDPTYEPTTLPVKLLGTMVVTPEEFSSASLELDRKDQKVVGVGAEILDGKATIVAIRRAYVVLRETDKLTIAPLFARPENVAGMPGPNGVPTSAPTEPPRMPTRASVSERKPATPQVEGVQKLSDTAYKLDRKHVNDKLKDLASLGKQVRIVPNYQNGKYSGVRMIGMQGESLFKDIGFENSDILLAVNGEQLDSPNKALSLYDALKNKARLTVLLERGGIAKTLRYTIQ